MKVKVTANTEFQGNVTRFCRLLQNGKIKFVLFSLKNGDILNANDILNYEIVDTTIEQGHRFIVELEMLAETNNVSDIQYVCIIEKNPYVNVVENKITDFDYLDN